MSSEKNIISLKSSDGETFEIEEAIAVESVTIKHMIEDDCAGDDIPVPNVTAKILAKVIEYCRKHVQASEKSSGEGGDDVVHEDLKNFDSEFKKQDIETLLDILMAANYLNIKKLFDFLCITVADQIKDKSVEEVRTIFDIKNDYTPEEEAEIRAEYPWAFE